MTEESGQPTLSVRVLTYNYGGFLTQCLESVLAQTFDDFEVVLIDDASTDDSLAIAESYAAKDPRIRVASHATNQGFIRSLLHSVELSRGRYLMQLDADDWVLEPDAFAVLVDVMDRHPRASFGFSPYAIHDAQGALSFVAPVYDTDRVLPGEIAIATVMDFNVPHTGTIVRRTAYDAVGGYDATYPYGADMKLFYSLCAVGDVAYVNRPLFGYRAHGSGMSSKHRQRAVFDDSIRAVESVFAGELGRRIPDARRVRRHALQSFLQHHPTQLVFSGRYREGWTTLLQHARRMPALTLLQPNTVRLLARTMLGERGYARLRRGGGRAAAVASPSPTGGPE